MASPSSSSECSSVVTSTKRARSPRKRPNQSYTEAAVLLSKAYPKVFTANTFRRHRYTPLSFCSVSPPPPPPPHFLGGGFLIEDDPSPVSGSCRFDPKPAPTPQQLCAAGFEEQGSPPDYDVECILDEEVGIDSIMGKLTTESNVSGVFAPLFGGLMGFGTGGQSSISIRQALRGTHRGEWWRSSTMVEVKDIVPELDVLPKKKKKKKKSKVVVVVKELEGTLKSGLGLKLNYEGVVDAWSDRQFPFAKGAGVPEFSADDLARLAETDLTPDTEGGGAREGKVQRFREKRKTRLFSKKIHYQVRKVNADCRPRMKASGRFAKRFPHQEAKEAR
ncbi:protein CHLOROPLAST IMPORT APPARATUS 2-like [Iris pallida]|uniref:Protein CHLOROPLAST IMPORT APPARATUS 2-like n=1 Tax=Iris pallida TaxID=29817 RepID=A0AAX6E8H8_IRIPA|nr:protein CHLOROPLAST IMPORT APPARATUS 2-like [Iris pallida]